jgi:hypothetical protein
MSVEYRNTFRGGTFQHCVACLCVCTTIHHTPPPHPVHNRSISSLSSKLIAPTTSCSTSAKQLQVQGVERFVLTAKAETRVMKAVARTLSMVRSSRLLLALLSLLLCTVACTQAFNPQDILKAAQALGGQGGGGGACAFKCPSGASPEADPDHTPQSNGCGAGGMSITTPNVKLLTSCCNWHDKCFGTCNKDRDWCERGFEKCLKKKCLGLATAEARAGCQSEADMYTGAAQVSPVIKAERLIGPSVRRSVC